MAITLNQNEFLANIVNLIVETRVNKTVSGRRINDLIDSAMVDQIEYGDGKLLLTVDTLDVKEYSQTSSILNNDHPRVDEQYLDTTDTKFIHVTLNRYLLKGAFANEYSMSEAISTIEGMLQKTKDIFTYRKIISGYEGWAPKQATQTVTVDLQSTTGLTGADLEQANKNNALAIYTKIREISLNMQAPSRDYNDLGFEEMYNADDLHFVINGKFDSIINTYAYASLLNSAKLDNVKLYDKSIIIPNAQISSENKETLIGYLSHKEKYQIAPRFIVGTDWFDSSNLNLQEYLHFWLISGIANGLAGVKLVANFVNA